MSRRRLDAELVRRGLAASRTEAQRLVDEGHVVVGGYPQPKAATQVDGATSIRVAAPLHPYVSRGGLKLRAALDAFAIDPTGRSVIDLGASTGGFTDCALAAGAASVVAVDVGYGQLAERLRTDPRVLVADRTHVRDVDLEAVGGPFGLVVGDLSFISLCAVAEEIARLGEDDADWVLLVKPQFEVGRERVGRGGIVRDPMLHAAALTDTVACLAEAGLVAVGVVASPIAGAKGGNREFLLHLRRTGSPVDADSIRDAVEAVAP